MPLNCIKYKHYGLCDYGKLWKNLAYVQMACYGCWNFWNLNIATTITFVYLIQPCQSEIVTLLQLTYGDVGG